MCVCVGGAIFVLETSAFDVHARDEKGRGAAQPRVINPAVE